MLSRFFVLSVLIAGAAGQPRPPRCEAVIVMEQGEKNSTIYSQQLVYQGLDKGLGKIMNLTVLYVEGHAPGVAADPAFHPFTACSQYVTTHGLADPSHLWFNVLSCAMNGDLIAYCLGGVPQFEIDAIKTCTDNATLSASLVQKMHNEAAALVQPELPVVIADGKHLPPSRFDGGLNINPLIREICGCAPTTPPACN